MALVRVARLGAGRRIAPSTLTRRDLFAKYALIPMVPIKRPVGCQRASVSDTYCDSSYFE